MKTLQLLANSFKHNPSGQPDKQLLKHLNLALTVKYASLPESRCFRAGLATSLNLTKDADYCEIADELLHRVDRLFADVRKTAPLRKIKNSAAPFGSDEFYAS